MTESTIFLVPLAVGQHHGKDQFASTQLRAAHILQVVLHPLVVLRFPPPPRLFSCVLCGRVRCKTKVVLELWQIPTLTRERQGFPVDWARFSASTVALPRI